MIEIFDFNEIDYVFFSQEEIHETGMAPKGKEHLKETFYPESYDYLNVLSLTSFLSHGFDIYAIGGRVEQESIFWNKRWYCHWPVLKWYGDFNIFKGYTFVSGACFLASSTYVKKLSTLSSKALEDSDWKWFAWYWERMWGTIAEAHGGKFYNRTGVVERILKR